MADYTVRKGTALLLGGNIVQAIAGLSAQIVLLRHLVPEDLGRFVLVLASASLIQSLVSLRVNVLAIRADQADLDDGLEERYRCCIFWEVVVSSSLTLCWLWIAGLLNVWAAILLCALILNHWTDHNRAFYERKMPYAQIAYIETGSQMLGHGAAVLLVLMGAGAAALYLRELLAGLVRTAAFLVIGALPFVRPRWLAWREWKSLMHEAAPVWLDGFGEGMFNRLMLMTISGLAGVRAVGLFSQAHRLAIVPNQLLAPFVSRVMINWFSRLGSNAERRRILVLVLGVLGFLLTGAAVLAVLLADPIVPFLFGPAWAEAADVLAAMAGVILFMSLFETVRGFCLSQRRSRTLLLGRATLYGVFFGGVGLLMMFQSVSVFNLGIMLSCAVMSSFVVMVPGALRVIPEIVRK